MQCKLSQWTMRTLKNSPTNFLELPRGNNKFELNVNVNENASHWDAFRPFQWPSLVRGYVACLLSGGVHTRHTPLPTQLYAGIHTPFPTAWWNIPTNALKYMQLWYTPPCGPTHLWKKYLSATSFAGSKITIQVCIPVRCILPACWPSVFWRGCIHIQPIWMHPRPSPWTDRRL